MIYLKWEVFFLHFVAMYPLPKGSNLTLKFAFYLWRFFYAFCIISLSILSLVDVAKREDFVFIDVAINIMNSGIYYGGLARVFYFYMFGHKTQKIVEGMNALFRHESETGMESEETMADRVAFSSRFSRIWTGQAAFTCGLTAVLPLLFIAKMGKTIPVEAWYPYDWRKPWFYGLTMLSQTMTQLFMCLSYSNPLMFYLSVTHLTTGQFKILNWEVKNVIYTALIKFGINKEKAIAFSKTFNAANPTNDVSEEILALFESSQLNRVVHDCFASCVAHHQELLEFCRELNAFLSPLLLAWLFFSVFYFIFISFSMVVATNQNTILTLGEYLTLSLVELLIVAYFGQMLTDQSEKLGESLYETPWYICDRKFASTFKFAQFRASFPVIIRAGNYFPISLELFINICKLSASYFAVLREVTE